MMYVILYSSKHFALSPKPLLYTNAAAAYDNNACLLALRIFTEKWIFLGLTKTVSGAY